MKPVDPWQYVTKTTEVHRPPSSFGCWVCCTRISEPRHTNILKERSKPPWITSIVRCNKGFYFKGYIYELKVDVQTSHLTPAARGWEMRGRGNHGDSGAWLLRLAILLCSFSWSLRHHVLASQYGKIFLFTPLYNGNRNTSLLSVRTDTSGRCSVQFDLLLRGYFCLGRCGPLERNVQQVGVMERPLASETMYGLLESR